MNPDEQVHFIVKTLSEALHDHGNPPDVRISAAQVLGAILAGSPQSVAYAQAPFARPVQPSLDFLFNQDPLSQMSPFNPAEGPQVSQESSEVEVPLLGGVPWVQKNPPTAEELTQESP